MEKMTSFLFSVLYYGSEIWSYKHLSFMFKESVRSIPFKALRTVFGDMSRDESQSCFLAYNS